MASLSDPPALRGYLEAVNRDSALLRRGLRLAKRQGDIEKAMEFAAVGDKMGIPVGRVTHHEELQGTAEGRFSNSLQRAGQSMPASGLDAYDSRQSQDRRGPTPVSRLETYRQAWKGAKTQEEKDAIVEQGQADGIPLSPYGVQSLSRRRSTTGGTLIQGPSAQSQSATEPLLPAPKLDNPIPSGAAQTVGPTQGLPVTADSALEDRFAAGTPLSPDERGRLSKLPSMRHTSLAIPAGQAGATGPVGASATIAAPVPAAKALLPAPYDGGGAGNTYQAQGAGLPVATQGPPASAAPLLPEPATEGVLARRAQQATLQPLNDALTQARQRHAAAKAAEAALPEPSAGYRERFADAEGGIDMGKVEAYRGQRVGELERRGREALQGTIGRIGAERQLEKGYSETSKGTGGLGRVRGGSDPLDAAKGLWWRSYAGHPLPTDTAQGMQEIQGQPDPGDPVIETAKDAMEQAGRGLKKWIDRPAARPALETKRSLFRRY